ncbi:S-layer homology domain-containing protein [Tumebacillus sp. ITR2]|uniref:S-layer homology domain-containing protein n=1 Tax=Tumebacillus amylolyticus TaxID=2801339 RepID=A0ABS1J4U4_9BACL|nr:alpha-amylase family glycosyl hydrolase [Tumebacillus amylolyticus]MBL0385299.1 S-layer homology domain-containing protein [Tumebacillus amylolyticus]
MKLFLRRKQARIWSLITAVLLVVQAVGGSLWPAMAGATTNGTYVDGSTIHFVLPKTSVVVEAKGDFNGWSDPAVALTDGDSDGTYTADVTGQTPSTDYGYKFLVNGNYLDGSNLTATSDANGDLHLSYTPHFSVAGSFDNAFNTHHDLTNTPGTGTYEYVSDALADGDYTYKFIASADGLSDLWFLDPINTAVSNGNSKITVGTPPTPTVQADPLADQPGGKSKWVVVGSFQGWNNASTDTQLKHLVGDFYEYSTVLDAGHYEFKVVRSGSWDGYSDNGNNFSFDLTETTKVNFYVNEALNQVRTNLPNIAGIAQYTPQLSATDWPRLVGDIQTVFGEPAWSPDQAKQFFVDYNFDGSLYKLQRSLPAGKYEMKVVQGDNWGANNYGANGANFVLQTLDPADVTFSTTLADQTLVTDYKPADGKSDGMIHRDKIQFDSRSVTYKKPFGAIKEGMEDLTLRIATEAGDAQVVRAELTSATGLASAFDMHKATSFDNTDYWEVTIPKSTFQGIGVWGYKFILIDGPTKVEYGDDTTRGGAGVAADDGAIPFDLTVYKADFKTPDWMKNAVVYQIFPDRFFDGNPDNNRAKTVDGYRGGAPVDGVTQTSKGGYPYQYFDGGVANDPTPNQVWGNWSDVPESPDRTTPEQKPYFPDAKTDGLWTNEFYGGDIQGAQQKLNYLKSLGVTVIYFNPVAWASSNHKYDATDYKHLDPMFGEPVYNTPGDPTSGLDYEKTRVASDRVFTEFAKQARAQGIKLIVDGVFNHVGDDSIYFDRYSKYPEIGAYEFWAKVYDKVNAGTPQANAMQEVIDSFTAQINPLTGQNYKYPEDFDFTTWFTVSNEKVDGHYKYEGWWGYDSLPTIDATEPAQGDTEGLPGQHEWNVQGYRDNVIGHDLTGLSTDQSSALMQYANSQRWEYLGARGWRLDVAPDVSAGTWQQFRKAVKSTGGLQDANGQSIDDPIILGEEWGVATRFLLGDQFDSVMNYRFRGALQSFIISGNAQQFNDALESIREDYPAEAWKVMLNLVDSHDTIRSITKYDRPDWEEEHLAIAPDATDMAIKKQALTAIFQMGYPGAPTINYGDEVGLTGTKDPDSRRSFPWTRVTESNGTFAGGDRYADLFATYQKAANLRDSNEAFRTGDLKVAYQQGDVIAYARKTDTKAGLVVINRGANDASIDANVAGFLPDGLTLQDQLGSSVQGTVVGGKLSLTVKGLSGMMMTSAQDLVAVEPVKNVAAVGGNIRVTLTWDAVAEATGYNVYRAPIEGGTLQFVGSVTDTTWSDVNVQNGKKYYYTVTAKTDNGESALSDYASATPSFPIQSVEITQQSTPVTLGAGNMTSEIQVTLNIPGLTDDAALAGKDAPNLLARLFYYKEGTSKALAMDTKLRYKSDTNDGQKVYWAQFEPTQQGAHYYFAKVSTDNGDTWTESAQTYVDVYADPNDTTPPAAPVLAGINVESNQAQLNWMESDSDVYQFEIYRKSTGTDFQLVAVQPKTATSYVDYTVSNDTAYTYKVAAVDASYNRAYSAEQSVTPTLVMVDVKVRVHLPNYTPVKDDIYMAGDLNGWNASGYKLTVPSGATSRDVVEYSFKMMAGKSIQYKYTRGSWSTEALTSHDRKSNDTTDPSNYAYSSTDTNMKLTIKNQGGNQMVVDDYVLRWVDMPMIVTMPRISYGDNIAYTTSDDHFTLKANVPYGVNFTINGQPIQASQMDAAGNVLVENIPLAEGQNHFTVHIEPSAETLNLPWYTDKGRASQATKSLDLDITRDGNTPDPDPTVPVTGVTLNATNIKLSMRSAPFKLAATVLPANATVKDVTWSSSDTNVATVNAEGTITAVHPGHAVITVTTKDGNKTASASVNVNNASSTGNENSNGKPDDKTKTVTTQTLQDALNSGASSDKKVSVDVEGKTKVLLPTNTVDLLGTKNLELKQGNLSLDVPTSTLNQLLKQGGTTAGQQISLQFQPLEEQAKQDLLTQAGTKGKASLTAASDVYDFHLALVGADGQETTSLSQFDQPLLLTFKVSDNANKKLIGVYYLADDGKLEFVGGKLNADGTMTVEIHHFSKYAVLEFNKHFADLSTDHWAAGVIQELTAKHVISGTSDDSFEPERSITRAEFAALLVRTLDLKASKAATFTDVNASDWYATSVAAANEAGLVFGRTASEFAPNEGITREEMASMLMRAYEVKSGNKANGLLDLTFTDAGTISPWAKASIQGAVKLGFLAGEENNRFLPQGKTTRAESAQVISKLLEN